jgi:hypothetical protein
MSTETHADLMRYKVVMAGTILMKFFWVKPLKMEIAHFFERLASTIQSTQHLNPKNIIRYVDLYIKIPLLSRFMHILVELSSIEFYGHLFNSS